MSHTEPPLGGDSLAMVYHNGLSVVYETKSAATSVTLMKHEVKAA